MADEPNDSPEQGAGSRFALVMAVAKRAKQLRDGSPRLVEIKSKNTITIALEEIARGLITMRIPSQEEIEAAERMESVPKSSAREAAELLKITEHEEEPEAILELPAEAVVTERAAVMEVEAPVVEEVETPAPRLDDILPIPEDVDEGEEIEVEEETEEEETPSAEGEGQE